MSPSGASVNVWTFLIVVFESLNCSQCEKMNLKIQFKWKGFKYAKDAGFCRTRMIFLKNSAQFNGSLLCVCVCVRACVRACACTLDGLNAEHKFWVWVTILGPMSRHFHRFCKGFTNFQAALYEIYIYSSGGPLSALTCCVNVRLLSAIKKISPLIYSQSWVGSWVYTTQAMMTFTLIF